MGHLAAYSPSGNEPSKEYLKRIKAEIKDWEEALKTVKNDVTRDLIEKNIQKLDYIVQSVEQDKFFYSILDLLFKGEFEQAENRCSDEEEYIQCLFLYYHPDRIIEDIYVKFVEEYNIK